MQRVLTNSEHDRKIMAERLEALKAAQQDAKNRYNVQQDRMQQMKNEQADAEVKGISSLCDIALVKFIALCSWVRQPISQYCPPPRSALTDC